MAIIRSTETVRDAEALHVVVTEPDWLAVQASEDFQQMRNSLKRFILPVTIGFLSWYAVFVLMTAYARGFMSQQVIGNINVAIVMGLLQFLSTFVIAAFYERHSTKKLDPVAARVRAEIEAGQW